MPSLSTPEALSERAIAILADLVAFDTTSRRSNLELIAYVEAKLNAIGVASRRIGNAYGSKANLIASIGPAVEGGIVLSGHTDVVPVDGQPWTSDPFVLTERDGKLFARGAADMKGFLALTLAAAPDFANGSLSRPAHLAFSYDEEIGCLGAPDLVAEIVREVPRPDVVLVGEPTLMEVVSGHKGISVFRVTVHGREAHSSLTHLGVSAVMAAAKLMGSLADLAEALERGADPHSPFHPPHATLTIGTVQGGTAGNILARRCEFLFDLRCPPGQEARTILEPFRAEVAALDAALKSRAPEAGVVLEQLADVPPLHPETDGAAERLVRSLAGDNGPARAVAYGAEAGQFQQAGYSTVICGPGSIEQAHQADEFVARAQMQRGAAFMTRLVEALR
jgi:acetylornithine deacetylase